MPYQNQFSINLNQQKARAKKLLKAIKHGDEQALLLINKYQNAPGKLTPDNIKLADVQFSIARELGLPSWSKLKVHADELQGHRKAIEANEPGLDRDMRTLHIRCGHDIQDGLKQAGFTGEFLPMIDPLCIGPVPSSDTHFIAIRAAYVAQTLLPVIGNAGSTEDVVRAETENLQTLFHEKFQRLVLWVEHDSYDQLMLLRVLVLLENHTNRRIEIIELNDFPGTERFMGFGQLPVEAIRACWKKRKPVTARQYSQAKIAWRAITSKTPDLLISLLKKPQPDCFANLHKVILRHLQELPNMSCGLGMTQHLALGILQKHGEPISFGEWFRSYQQREPLPFLGDTMFYALLMPLSRLQNPLFTVIDESKPFYKQKFVITQEGSACLSGELKLAPDYWVGGICLKPDNFWCWDHQDLSSMKQIK